MAIHIVHSTPLAFVPDPDAKPSAPIDCDREAQQLEKRMALRALFEEVERQELVDLGTT